MSVDAFTAPSRDPLADIEQFLAEAVDALTLDNGTRINPTTGEETPIPDVEMCISEELDRMDRALALAGRAPTMLSLIADETKRALMAVLAAQAALKALRP